MNQFSFYIKCFPEDEEKFENFLTQTFGAEWRKENPLQAYKFLVSSWTEEQIFRFEIQRPPSSLLIYTSNIGNFRLLIEEKDLKIQKTSVKNFQFDCANFGNIKVAELLNSGPILYHYTSAEKAIKVLENNSLMFNHHDNFNDDFDTKFHECYINIPDDNALATELEKRNISFSPAANDMRTFFEELRSSIIKNLHNIRIFCFTKHRNISSMWAHYAQNHTGVVLGFSTLLKDNQPDEGKKNDGLFKNNDHFQICYSQYSPICIDACKAADCFQEWLRDSEKFSSWIHDEIIIPIIQKKSHHWAYEQEYRKLVYVNEGSPESFCHFWEQAIPHRQIFNIILGKNIKPVDQLKILKITQERKLPIVVAKVTQLKNNYKYKTNILYNGRKNLMD